MAGRRLGAPERGGVQGVPPPPPPMHPCPPPPPQPPLCLLLLGTALPHACRRVRASHRASLRVQVITRFLVASPMFYWAAAEVLAPGRAYWPARLLVFYFLAWGMLGSLMFCNFYPWT